MCPSASFGICNSPFLHDMQFGLNQFCTPTSSRRIRTSTVPHIYVDVQTHTAEELSGDTPLAVLADGTTRKRYRLEAFMGECMFTWRQPHCVAVRHELPSSKTRTTILGLVTVDHSQSTAANQYKLFNACAVQLGTRVDRFVVAVTDGAAAARLFARKTGALTVHCAAHRVQLIVCAGLKKVPLVTTLSKLQTLVSVPQFRKTMLHFRNLEPEDSPCRRIDNLFVSVQFICVFFGVQIVYCRRTPCDGTHFWKCGRSCVDYGR
jgi:hypothetical protein